MNKFNVILLADFTSELFLQRTLGVHKIASELRLHGFDVQVINHLHIFSIEEIENILSHLINHQTLFVGFSTFFYLNIENKNNGDDNYRELYSSKERGSLLPHGLKYNEQILNLIKSKNANCKLVLGGPDAIDAPYVKYFDYTVTGYAESAVVNLANHLAYGTELLRSRRSIYKSTIIDGGKAEEYDFSATPMYFDHGDIIMPNETLPMEVARGCIFKCSFCAFPLNGKKKRDHVKLEELLKNEFLDNYEKFKVTRYIFADDTFNDDIEKIRMIHRISTQLPFKLEYWAFIRLDLLSAHPETIELLFDSGLRSCFFGIETLNPTAASSIGKGGDRQRHSDTLKYIKKKYGNSVTLHGSFIFGLPTETIASMKSTAEVLLNSSFGLDTWHISPLSLTGNTQTTTLFKSELDINYSKYGYVLKEWIPELKSYDWENTITNTNFKECEDLVNYTTAQNPSQIVAGITSFYLSSLGFGLDYSMNKSVTDCNWQLVRLAKFKQSEKYKQKLLDHIKLTPKEKEQIEYRLHYNEAGEIHSCTMVQHPKSNNYIVVHKQIYDTYYNYHIVDGKLREILKEY